MKKSFVPRRWLAALLVLIATTPTVFAHYDVTPASGILARFAHGLAHLIMAAGPLMPIFGILLAWVVIRAWRKPDC